MQNVWHIILCASHQIYLVQVGKTQRTRFVGGGPDIPHALILRAKETFKGSCRTAKERYILTDPMAKIIIACGSQIRGKIIEAYRSLFTSHYGFERSMTKKVIDANRLKAENLIKNAAFHYKNTEERSGYAENKIIASLEFCVNEWSTGSFIQATFFEKDVLERYLVHVADAERWSNMNKVVVENIRRRWYRRASQTLTSAVSSTIAANIGDSQEDALRNELEGRMGDTDRGLVCQPTLSTGATECYLVKGFCLMEKQRVRVRSRAVKREDLERSHQLLLECLCG
ncbi:hypothetical protein C8R44DRAFT_750776 [Mycena epipterygia]|nr:hypothetical protein C8R44DRAFT_750776 [Mycena epipterygia]